MNFFFAIIVSQSSDIFFSEAGESWIVGKVIVKNADDIFSYEVRHTSGCPSYAKSI